VSAESFDDGDLERGRARCRRVVEVDHVDEAPDLGQLRVGLAGLILSAQQSERVRHVGVLVGAGAPADDTDAQSTLAACQQGPQQLGWSVGSNVRIDPRRGGGAERTRKYATEWPR
jgi:hypothetical protein